MNHATTEREDIRTPDNPIGMDGIEFIEYATSKPQALGQVLEMMGFRPIARHRSREVMLYRQGEVNIIVNAHHSLHSQSAAPDDCRHGFAGARCGRGLPARFGPGCLGRAHPG